MTTLRVRAMDLSGALADVVSVALADRPASQSPTYGVRRRDTGAVIVTAGTPMTKVTTGIYEYDLTDSPGVPYEWRFAAVSGGQTVVGGGSWVANLTPAEATLELTDFEEILLDNLDVEEDEYGEAVTVHPVGGADRICTAIVTRDPPRLEDRPREEYYPVLVSLRNDTAYGIGAAEWNNRFEITLPRHRGALAVRMRVVRKVKDDAARITWGCL
jgi:hypothetical protein